VLATELEKPRSLNLTRSQSQTQLQGHSPRSQAGSAPNSGPVQTNRKAEQAQGSSSEPGRHAEPHAPSTSIPITMDSAPFTPSKVHRPRATTDIAAVRPIAKHSFLAKQEFFERKDQESREQQARLNPSRPSQPPAGMSPTREFGLPVLVLSARREDEGESPREPALSPPESARDSPRDTLVSPREPTKASAPPKPMITKTEHKPTEPATEQDKEEPTKETKQEEPEPATKEEPVATTPNTPPQQLVPEPTPSVEPTPEPKSEPAPEPTPEPTPVHTPSEPTPESTPEPTPQPTPEPQTEPASEPTPEPTPEPTTEPAQEPPKEEKIPEPPTPEQQKKLE
jgi:hypothetical protein